MQFSLKRKISDDLYSFACHNRQRGGYLKNDSVVCLQLGKCAKLTLLGDDISTAFLEIVTVDQIFDKWSFLKYP